MQHLMDANPPVKPQHCFGRRRRGRNVPANENGRKWSLPANEKLARNSLNASHITAASMGKTGTPGGKINRPKTVSYTYKNFILIFTPVRDVERLLHHNLEPERQLV